MTDTGESELTFEEAMTRVEAIVAEMEAGRLSLEESMTRFEEGMKLCRSCAAKLEATEKRIEMLVRASEQGLEWQDMSSPAAEEGSDAGND